MKSFILIAASALLLQSALMWPAQCAWMVFIFLMPLFYRVVRFPLRAPYKEGWWWGLLFYTCHLFALFLVFHEKANGPFRYLAAIIFTLYCSVYAGLWFGINALIARRRSQRAIVLWWGLGAWMYFYWVAHYMLWPCGHLVGYCFGAPLLPLAAYPSSLYWIVVMGSGALTASLILLQVFALLFLVARKWHYLAITAFCAAPFYCGFFSFKSESIPPYLATLCYVRPPSKSLIHPMDCAEEINMCIAKALQSKPSATCILMPESSFAHCLNLAPEAIELWGINSLANGYSLCIGSSRADTYNEYNSLFIIKDCRITDCYDKSFLMPFVEYLPNFGKKYSWIRNLFLKDQTETKPKESRSRKLILTDCLTVDPMICSDLYMQPYGIDTFTHDHSPILLAVNDSWFSAEYAKELMFLYAVYYAMQNKKDILYIGHRFGCWISNVTGEAILL